MRVSADIANRFSYHPATAVTGPVHDSAREIYLTLAAWIETQVPSGRHKSLALTALQESMMWTNAAIACDTPTDVTS